MGLGLAWAVLQCAAIAVAYVACLYVWRTQGTRHDKDVIIRRMISVMGCSCMSWIPLATWHGTLAKEQVRHPSGNLLTVKHCCDMKSILTATDHDSSTIPQQMTL